MKKLLQILIFFIVSFVQSQNSQIFLSETLDKHIPKYLLEVETAIKNREQDSVKFIFEKLVSHKLVGSYMDNVHANNLSRNKKDLSSFDKPLLLITNPAWRLDSKGEQAALNKLAQDYSDKVTIALLYWGDVRTVKKLSKGYDRNIEVLYVDDSDNKNTRIIKNLKHSLGLPLAFTMKGDKEIVAIQKRLANRMSLSLEQSYEENLMIFEDLLKQLVLEESKSHSVPTAQID